MTNDAMIGLERIGTDIPSLKERHVPEIVQKILAVGPTVEIVDSLERFNELRDDWNRLADRFATPLLRHEWFSACAMAFCPPGRLRIYVLRSEGAVKAIAPLIMTRTHGMQQLEILGAAQLFEPAGILFSDTFALDRLMEAIQKEGCPMVLRRLPLEPVVYSLSNDASRRKHFVIEHENTSPWIPIRSSWEEFEKNMRSKQRSGLRRVRKKLETQGNVELEVFSGRLTDFQAALQSALEIEASGWKGRNGTAILCSSSIREFFTEYVRQASEKDMVRVFLLRVGDRAIAMALAVLWADKLWVLKVGYDESWSTYAPGIILHHEVIRWAYMQKLSGFEFLGSSEAFIVSRWATMTQRYRSYRIFPKTVGGILWLGVEACRTLVKRIADARRSRGSRIHDKIR